MDGSVVSTMNYLVPASGTTSGYPVSGVFSATPVVQDWRLVNLDGEQFVPSGVFIDNSQGTGPLTVFVQNANFSVVCPAGGRVSRQYPAPLDQITSITGQGQATVIFVNFPVLPTSDVASSASTAVTIADGANATFGAVADAPAANDTGNFTFMSFVKRMSAALTNMFVTGAAAQTVQGNSASGVADVGAPVKIGGVYGSAGALAATAVGNRADFQADAYGNSRSLMAMGALTGTDGVSNLLGFPANSSTNLVSSRPIPTSAGMLFNGTTWDRQRGDLQGAFTQQDVSPDWNYVAGAGGITNTTNTVIKTSGGGATVNYLTSLSYMNTSAVAAEFTILNGPTPIFRCPMPANMTQPILLQFPRPLRASPATNLQVNVSVTATATFVNAQGFTK